MKIGAWEMPKHIVRLLLLLLGFLVFAYAGIVVLTDPSFYRFGHYRADVVPELAAGEPLFRGPEYCVQCHLDRHGEWSAGAHRTVKCEICHGPAGQHPATGKLPIPKDPVKLCTVCHEAMPARPASHPQIVVTEHPYPHETPVVCSTCHNPHSPRIGSPESIVQLPPVVQEPAAAEPEERLVTAPLAAAGCASCHGAQGQGVGSFPALAGMDFASFVALMNQFKTGQRPSPMMGALAKALNDAEIRELANYYAGLDAGNNEN
jgi:cytochrome c553